MEGPEYLKATQNVPWPATSVVHCKLDLPQTSQPAHTFTMSLSETQIGYKSAIDLAGEHSMENSVFALG